jgi:K+-sensing histidine kinase KdpD
VAETAKQESGKLPENTTVRLRSLAHDLSNSIETILQASYLLGQLNLDANGKKWAHLIDTATQDAARINREIRELLRSQDQG